MGGAFGYFLLTALLVFNGKGSAFPAGGIENAPIATGFDYDQYKFAQAVNNIIISRGTDENDKRWGDGDNPFGGHIIKPYLVKYRQISKETADRICQDFEVNIFVKSEGRLIDCGKMRKDLKLKKSELIHQQAHDGRFKRNASEDGGSGGTSTEPAPKENVPSPNDVIHSNSTRETKTDMMKNPERKESPSLTEKPNLSTTTESISNKTDTKVEIKDTDKLETSISTQIVTSKPSNKTEDINLESKLIDKSISTNKPITGKADNETKPITSTQITLENKATTKNILTQNIMPNVTSAKPQNASEITTEKSQNTPIVVSNTEKTTNRTQEKNNSKMDQQNAETNLTKSEVNITSHLKSNVTTIVTPEDNKQQDSDNITTSTPEHNVNTTNIGQKESNVKEGQDKPAINRKGKHMDLNAPQIQNPQNPKDTSLANQETEAGKNLAAKEAAEGKNQTVGASEPKTDQSTKKTAGNSGIIWFLFGGVVIIGAALIGYRMMKKRKQQRQPGNVNKRTAKESATETSNTSNREQEMKPLMSDVGAKQNNTTNGNDTTIHEMKNVQESNAANNEIKQENMQENKSHGEGDKITEINETKGTQSSNAKEDKSLEK